MRKVSIIVALGLAACATAPRAPAVTAPAAGPARPAATPQAEAHWDALPLLGPMEVALARQKLADEPEAAGQLVAAMPGVCGVTDPEKREAALDGAWQRVSDGMRAAAATPRWRITLTTELGGYDVPHAAFPTGLTEAAGPSFGRSDYCWQAIELAVQLQNAHDFAELPVTPERARAFVRGNLRRVVQQDLEVEVVGARPGPPRALLVRILRLRLRDVVAGAVLADSGL